VNDQSIRIKDDQSDIFLLIEYNYIIIAILNYYLSGERQIRYCGCLCFSAQRLSKLWRLCYLYIFLLLSSCLL